MIGVKLNDLLLLGKNDDALSLLESNHNSHYEKLALQSWLHGLMGNNDMALDIAEKVISFGQEQDQFIILIGNIVKTYSKWRAGKNQVAESLLDEQMFIIDVKPKHDQVLLFWKGLGYILLGNISLVKGTYTKASYFYNQALEIGYKLKDNYRICSALNNIAEIHKLKGEVEKALSMYEEGLSLIPEDSISMQRAIFLNNIGEIHKVKGNLDLAYQFIEKSLEIKSEIGNINSIGESLLQMIIISLEMGNIDVAKTYNIQLAHLFTNNDLLEIRKSIGEGLIRKNSNRIIDLAKAQEIFNSLAYTANVPIEYKIFSFLNLCDLLIFELKTYEHEAILSELNYLLNQLYKIGQEREMMALIIEIIFLKAKVALVENKTDAAFLLLDQAIIYSEENSLIYLSDKIEKYYGTLTKEFSKWIEIFSRDDATYRTKIENIQIEKYLSDLLKTHRAS